jgi:tripartite-type tricarboxylate transporter receptor subunit TctC
VPVAGLYNVPFIVEVHPSLPAATVDELIVYANANLGKINKASFGVGSAPHLAGELLKMRAGIDAVHVPYRREAPAPTDLIAGQIQLLFSTPTAFPCSRPVRRGSAGCCRNRPRIRGQRLRRRCLTAGNAP